MSTPRAPLRIAEPASGIGEFMYLDLFGLRLLPFRLRPDPAFAVMDAAYQRAFDRLRGSFQRREPLTVVAGLAGVGKTLLLECVLRAESNARPIIRINQPQMTIDELTQSIALQLNVSTEPGVGKTNIPAMLAGASPRSLPPLLIIDHAQCFAPELLESLLRLGRQSARLGILLLGRAGGAALPTWASGGDTRASVEPIVLRPLAATSVGAYIESRLAIAGAKSRRVYSDAAYGQIYAFTRGVPRSINMLCDLTMTYCAARRIERVTDVEVREAARDPKWLESCARDHDVEAAVESAQPAGAPIEPAAAAETHADEPTRLVAADSRILIARAGRTVANLPLAPGRVKIGRTANNDVTLDSKYISREHCELVTVSDGTQVHTILVDLGSSNGTIVNGNRIKRHRLQQGDIVQIGDFEMRCVGAGSAVQGGNRMTGR